MTTACPGLAEIIDWSHSPITGSPVLESVTSSPSWMRPPHHAEVEARPRPGSTNGHAKQVRYWAAEAVAGAFVPNGEVDRLVWLSPAEARGRLTKSRHMSEICV
ncbi:hypothetical protein ACFW1M_37225 [Streptomyces inhibens]|uniref:hypothetical protein n=1 Tax=Streptomyces inhibens TaxID=2293571 RepID=UPI0036ADDA79